MAWCSTLRARRFRSIRSTRRFGRGRASEARQSRFGSLPRGHKCSGERAAEPAIEQRRLQRTAGWTGPGDYRSGPQRRALLRICRGAACPFTPGKYYHFEPEHVATLLDLPAGGITATDDGLSRFESTPSGPPARQAYAPTPCCTMRPKSNPATKRRFRSRGTINGKADFAGLSRGCSGAATPGTPVEVVAESWPDENLIDSCVDCVDSWHHSPDHWSQVHIQHVGYGYDIKRGANGIWYATGIFSN